MSCDGRKIATVFLQQFLSVVLLGAVQAPWSSAAEGADQDRGSGSEVVGEGDQIYLDSSGAQKAVRPLLVQALIEEPGDIGKNVISQEEFYVSERLQAVRDAVDNPLTLMTHKSNYFLPMAYRELSEETSYSAGRYGVEELDPIEIQFQLSMQVPVWSGFWGDDSFLSLGYTNRSFWQAYSRSGPFRETNHEVELLATWSSDWQLFGFRNVVTQAGLSHQSNGRGEIYSRGWNRVFVDFNFEKGGYFFSLKPWYRLSADPDAGRGPDLDAHLGNFELVGGFRSGGYTSSVMLRNNLRSDNFGAVELNWKFPITNRVRGFIKYFDGYGESLIDYSVRVRTLGVGVELAPNFF